MIFEIKDNKILFGEKGEITYKEILESIGVLGNDVVYLAGSLVEGKVDKYSVGMGNLYSDVDVFIIREHQAFEDTEGEYVDDVRKTYFRNIKGSAIDIEVFDGKYVHDLQNALTNMNIDKGVRLLNVLKQTLQKGHDLLLVNTFLNRLKYSVCIFNETLYDKIRASMEFDVFLKLKAYHSITLIDNIMEDIKGNLISEEPDVALHSLRTGTMKLMEAILAHEGIFVDREKWTALKFANLARSFNKYSSAFKLYSEVFRGGMADDAICLEKIARLVPILKTETERILTGDLDI